MASGAEPFRNELVRVFGIGGSYASALHEIGIQSLSGLENCDPPEVVAAMRERKYFRSEAEIYRWKKHAESWRTNEVVHFGDGLAVGQTFIALDLEYLPKFIWLVGACVVSAGGRKHFTWWSDSMSELETNLCGLLDLVRSHPTLPIVTWAGICADIPQLRRAARYLPIDGLLEELSERHVDLFEHSRISIRFPIYGLALKDISRYWDVSRKSKISGGMEACWRYNEYCATVEEKKRKSLKSQLIRYNKDDLECLATLTERIRDLTIPKLGTW